MLSAHYAGTHSPVPPMLSSQQAQYAHQHTLSSSLLPTPPSSPPTIGMHPVENTISLLESLVAFYHQERMWVYRTRAQLEMGLLQCQLDSSGSGVDTPLDDDSGSPAQSASSPDLGNTAEKTSSSPPTKWLKRKKAFNLKLEGISSTRSMLPATTRGGISKHPHPHTQHRARQSSNLNPASAHQSAMNPPAMVGLHPHPSISSNAPSFYPPTAVNAATTLTSPYLSHPSLQFQTAASQPPLTAGVSTPRYVSTPSHHAHSAAQLAQIQQAHAGPLVLGAGGREPAVQILEMFERMMQARMESCERVTRMVREAAKPGGVGGGATVGGPVGGFGGPVGLPVGIGPQEIVGGYTHVQTAGEGPAQTPVQEGFGLLSS